jgi:hypothetical protein
MDVTLIYFISSSIFRLNIQQDVSWGAETGRPTIAFGMRSNKSFIKLGLKVLIRANYQINNFDM